LSSAPLRSYTRIAIAIVIAAVVLSASALSYASFEATVTRTVTGSTVTQTSMVIQTNTTTVTGVSCASLSSTLCFEELSNITVTAPKFIEAENGLHYVFYENETSVGSSSGPGFNNTTVGLMYWAYGNQTVTVCSGAGTSRNILGELTVTIPLKGSLWIVSSTTIIPNDYTISCPTTTHSTQQSGPVTWFTTYGGWNYSMTLTSDTIQQDENLTATFQLTNVSNQTQRVDVDDPLVLPTILTQNGKVVWAYQPPSYNEIENVTAGQTLSEQLVLPAWMLTAGQSYIVSTAPGIGTRDFTVDIGSHLQLNETITIA
jgi:hypothetical protein